jgi:hypothetical protein
MALKQKKKPKNAPLTPDEQHARFVEAAKEAEADESPDALDKAMRKISIHRLDPDLRRKRATP